MFSQKKAYLNRLTVLKSDVQRNTVGAEWVPYKYCHVTSVDSSLLETCAQHRSEANRSRTHLKKTYCVKIKHTSSAH